MAGNRNGITPLAGHSDENFGVSIPNFPPDLLQLMVVEMRGLPSIALFVWF
jgi:hypothetical protein